MSIIKRVKNFFSSFFTNREKRVEYTLEGLKDLQTIAKSNISDGVLTATALINAGVAASLVTGKKALVLVLPEVIKIFDVMASSDNSTDIEVNLLNVKSKLITLGFSEENVNKAVDIIRDMLKDQKLTVKEILQLLNYLNSLN